MTTVDFGRYSDDYAAHRPGFPASFYRKIDAIIPIRESRSLDLATGPGTMALDLASRGSTVVGIDISPQQIGTARRIARERSLQHRVDFRIAGAEHTGLEANSFDLVTAGQCWHWFDRGAVLRETHRVLRPRGVLAVAYYSYLAELSAVARDTEELIMAFNPSWTMAGSTGVFPEIIDEFRRGEYRRVEQFCYDHDEVFSHARWRGRIRTCNGVGSGDLPPTDVERFDQTLRRLLADKYPDPLVVPHRVWCAVARKPESSSRAS